MAFIVACASASPGIAPGPVSAPGGSAAQPTLPPPLVSPVSAKSVPRSGSWNFAYAPGTFSYAFTTNATIAPISDTTQRRVVPELSQTAIITISGTGDVQVVQPVIVTSASCDSNATLATRAQAFIPKLPNHITAGDRWRDSTTTSGCRGMIPAESTVISNYIAIGDTTLANTVVLQIHRTDLLTASGEGTEGQHRILVTAKGTGAADLFLDVASGRFVHAINTQTSLVNVNASGRLTQFVQHVTESISITAPR